MKLLENTAISNHEKQLKDLYDTVSNAKISDDLFANLKEEDKKEEESSFYTNTSKFDQDDFGDEVEKSGSTIFIVIAVVAIILMISAILYLKFLK